MKANVNSILPDMSSGSKGGSNTLLYIGIATALAIGGYYWYNNYYLPKQQNK
jgi:hypothetical protein